MSNNLNDSNNFTLMFSEIIKLSSALQQLSSNVDDKINRLPDNKDFDNSIKKLEKIINEIDNINNFINRSDTCDESLIKNVNNIKDELSNIKNTLSEKKTEINQLNNTSKEIKSLLLQYKNTFDSIYDVVCDDSSELLSKINNINDLTNKIKEQIHNSYVRLNNKHLQLHDIDEVISFAKRSNERYHFWKGWKGKMAIVVGAFMGVGFMADKITTTLKVLLEWIGG